MKRRSHSSIAVCFLMRRDKAGCDRVRWLPQGTEKVSGREWTTQTPLSSRGVLWLQVVTHPWPEKFSWAQGLGPVCLCFVAAVLPSYKYLLGEVRKADSSQQCPVTGLEAMVRNWNTWISTKQRKIFFTVRVAALEQVVHRGCGLSIPVDIQNPTGHRTEQRALAEPVWEWELD